MSSVVPLAFRTRRILAATLQAPALGTVLDDGPPQSHILYESGGQSNKKKPGGQKARLFGTFAVRKIQQHRFWT